MKPKQIILRFIIFSMLLVASIWGISRWSLLSLRSTNSHEFNHEYFYKLEKDSIDVLFVGSSHSYCGFIPAVMYENYQISSYNLAISNQSMLANYLWVQEAYKTQHYKVLVVEVMSVPVSHGDVLNDIRSTNSMGNSIHYYELAKTYKKEGLKIIFPVLAFHSNWESIEKENYQKSVFDEACGMRGYVPLFSNAPAESLVDIIDETDTETTEYLKYPYLDKIREFCNENDIELILVKTPIANPDVNRWSTGMHNNVQQYADGYGIPFFDFNDESLQETSGVYQAECVAEDCRHCNITGAERITQYIGAYIKDTYGIESDENSFTEEDLAVYHDYLMKYGN